MYGMTVQEMLDKFTGALQSGWVEADDVIAYDYWTYDDVLMFVEGNDYYDDITHEVAREVWGKVVEKLSRYDNVDFDVVQDMIAQVLDETVGVN
jgi:hypothetical protein